MQISQSDKQTGRRIWLVAAKRGGLDQLAGSESGSGYNTFHGQAGGESLDLESGNRQGMG
jgi:hypothetical protein